MRRYELEAVDIVKLKPETLVECKCNVYFRIHEVDPDNMKVDASELGEFGCKQTPFRQNWDVEYMCLPMRLVRECMFEEVE